MINLEHGADIDKILNSHGKDVKEEFISGLRADIT